MEQISKLLKEAKPLYFQRKKRTVQIKAFCTIAFVCFVSIFSFANINTVDIINVERLAYTDSSVIAQYGLPVDDYGLFKVD